MGDSGKAIIPGFTGASNLSMSVLELGDISKTKLQRLADAGIETIRQLLLKTRADLLRLPSLGAITVHGIEHQLSIKGMSLPANWAEARLRAIEGGAGSELETRVAKLERVVGQLLVIHRAYGDFETDIKELGL